MSQIIKRLFDKPRAEQSYLNTEKAFESLIEDFFSPFANLNWRDSTLAYLNPKTDVAETEKSYIIVMEMPGVDDKNIEVSLNDGVLTIRAEKQSELEEKNRRYHRVERSYGTFQRSLYLSDGIDEDGIEAKYTSGVLKIIVPKSSRVTEAAKRIPVVT